MPLIQQTKRFDDQVKYVGERIKTCEYRFYKIIMARRKQIPRLKQSAGNPQINDQVRSKVLSTVDDYVNCLRGTHRGGQLPEYLLDTVNNFKDKVYTKLSPQFILEDERLPIARKIFQNNYAI